MTFQISADTRSTAGVLLVTILFVEYGGWFMLRVVRGRQPATDFQKAFFRAGHAHAGVLVTLALVGLLLADAARLSGPLAPLARNGIWAAAILMPAGFFLSAAGLGRTQPNRLVVLLYVGMASLALGVASLGISLLTTYKTPVTLACSLHLRAKRSYSPTCVEGEFLERHLLGILGSWGG